MKEQGERVDFALVPARTSVRCLAHGDFLSFPPLGVPELDVLRENFTFFLYYIIFFYKSQMR